MDSSCEWLPSHIRLTSGVDFERLQVLWSIIICDDLGESSQGVKSGGYEKCSQASRRTSLFYGIHYLTDFGECSHPRYGIRSGDHGIYWTPVACI